MTDLQRNSAPPPIKHGTYRVFTQAMRGAVKYTRAWNSGYDGPGKGTN